MKGLGLPSCFDENIDVFLKYATVADFDLIKLEAFEDIRLGYKIFDAFVNFLGKFAICKSRFFNVLPEWVAQALTGAPLKGSR